LYGIIIDQLLMQKNNKTDKYANYSLPIMSKEVNFVHSKRRSMLFYYFVMSNVPSPNHIIETLFRIINILLAYQKSIYYNKTNTSC